MYGLSDITLARIRHSEKLFGYNMTILGGGKEGNCRIAGCVV